MQSSKPQIIPQIIPRLLMMLLLVACAVRVDAQESGEPQFKMPCQEVLKLGLDKFADVYGERAGGYSTAGQKQAFAYYVDCRRPANDRLARSLPEARRRQVNAIRDELAKMGNASWEMIYTQEGGGTMYAVAASGAYATREDFIGTLIESLRLPDQAQPRARRRANASLLKVQRLLLSRARTKIEGTGFASAAEQRRQYLGQLREARAAAARLQQLVRNLPDAAAARVAARMADEVRNLEE
ncbi:MAG TPA: hypothetical protein VF723_12695 [Pyrinomonadaceae bacterium]|jgi:hypothetical protein